MTKAPPIELAFIALWANSADDRGIKSVHHNSSFLIFYFSAYLELRKLVTKTFVYYIVQPRLAAVSSD